MSGCSHLFVTSQSHDQYRQCQLTAVRCGFSFCLLHENVTSLPIYWNWRRDERQYGLRRTTSIRSVVALRGRSLTRFRPATRVDTRCSQPMDQFAGGTGGGRVRMDDQLPSVPICPLSARLPLPTSTKWQPVAMLLNAAWCRASLIIYLARDEIRFLNGGVDIVTPSHVHHLTLVTPNSAARLPLSGFLLLPSSIHPPPDAMKIQDQKYTTGKWRTVKKTQPTGWN